MVAATLSPTPLPTLGPTPSPATSPLAITTEAPAAPEVSLAPSTVALDASSSEPAAALDAPALDRKTTKKLQKIHRQPGQEQGRRPGSRRRYACPPARPGWARRARPSSAPIAHRGRHGQFAIASVTKTFVAALILQLAEEGKVDLDEPFGTYFTDAPRRRR